MLKPILTICLLFGCSDAFSQFITLTPPAGVTKISAIETEGTNVIIATDTGALIYNNATSAWQHQYQGLSSLNVHALEPTPGGFFYSSGQKKIGFSDYNTVIESILAPATNYDHISAIHVTQNGDTVLGTDNGIVWFITPAVSATINLGVSLGKITAINRLYYPQNAIDFLVIASTDKIALYEVSNNSAFIVSTTSTPIPSNKVLSNAVLGAVSYDGTDRGLYIADFTNFPNMNTAIVNRNNSPILSDTINAVAVNASHLCIGTPAGLCIRSNNVWHVFNNGNSNLPYNDIAALTIQGTDLFVAGKDGSLSKIDLQQLPLNVAAVAASRSLQIYPVPVSDVLHLGEAVEEVIILTLAGDVVVRAGRCSEVSTASIAPGNYVLVAHNHKETYRQPFIKK